MILLEDCSVGLRKLEKESVDLVVTSPPYDDLRSYNESSCWSFEKFKEVAKALTKTLKEGGVIVWNTADQVVNGSETGNSFRQALYFMDDCGLRLHDTMIWQKPNFSNPSKTRYHQVFDYVFILSKGAPKTFNPIIDRPNVYSGKVGSYGTNTVTQRDGSKKVRERTVNKEFGMRHNVWLMKTAGQDQSSKKWKHPAMFTEEFARDHILSWSNPDDMVIDPFAGSGTTAVAALRTGRRFLGFEIDETYWNLAIQRIQDQGSTNDTTRTN